MIGRIESPQEGDKTPWKKRQEVRSLPESTVNLGSLTTYTFPCRLANRGADSAAEPEHWQEYEDF